MKKRKYYLSDLFLLDAIKKNNLIIAPVGSGKTTFIFNHLIPRFKGKKLYLCDNCNLEEQVLNEKDTYSRKDKYIDKQDFIVYTDDKIEVMCYNAFAKKISNLDIKESVKIIEQYDLIVADEIHNLVDYQKFSDSKDLWQLMELLFTKKYDNTSIVLLTATPYYIEQLKKEFPSVLRGFRVFDFDRNKNIVRYLNKRKAYINHINQIENQLKQYEDAFEYGDMKCLIYTRHISDMKKIEAMCRRLNLNPISIWSINNKDHKLDEEQENVRTQLLETGYVIEPYNVLIINRAMETGVNIRDESIELVIVNTTNITEQIQARGRVRHDVDLIVVRTEDSDLVLKSQIINIPSKWLNVPLTKEDKDNLCKELQFFNDYNRPLKRTTIKKTLKENGYTVKSVKPKIDGKQVNCDIIKKIG